MSPKDLPVLAQTFMNEIVYVCIDFHLSPPSKIERVIQHIFRQFKVLETNMKLWKSVARADAKVAFAT